MSDWLWIIIIVCFCFPLLSLVFEWIREYWGWVLWIAFFLGAIACIVLGELGRRGVLDFKLWASNTMFGIGIGIVSIVGLIAIVWIICCVWDNYSYSRHYTSTSTNYSSVSTTPRKEKTEDEIDFSDFFDYDTYYLLIDSEQDLENEELDKKLKECSKKFREVLYKNNEFKNHISNSYVPYVFLKDEDDEDELIKCSNWLRENDVCAYISQGSELIEWLEEVQEQIKESNEQEEPEQQTEEKKQSSNKKSKNINTTDLINHEKLDQFDSFFDDKIIGQDKAIKKIHECLIEKSYSLDEENNRPLGIFFFVGPTGVGKTEMCKQLSEFLYGNKTINRFDMSEYKSEVAIQKLIGAPNGYVGYEEGGVLTNALKKNPNSILLFDEIEKADKTVFDLFLQMFDEGIITDNKGIKYYLKNNFIILTSNIGANLVQKKDTIATIEKKIKEAINNFFSYELNRPEILGRIGKDNIIVFNTISTKKDQFKILDIYFKKWQEDLNKNKTKVKFDKEHVYEMILLDVDITKGARDIRNEFDEFKKHFTKALYQNKLSLKDISNKTLTFDYDNVKVTLSK